MKLTEAQSRGLLRVYGAYVVEACDRCGAVLGPIRWTIRNEPGVWCSRKCRDGTGLQLGVCRGCGTALAGKRSDATYCGRTCRMRAVRKASQDSGNIVNTPIANKGLTSVISGFRYGDSKPEPSGNQELSNVSRQHP